jgi:hypothetical protein
MYFNTGSSAPTTVRLSRTPGIIVLAHDIRKLVALLTKYVRKMVATDHE